MNRIAMALVLAGLAVGGSAVADTGRLHPEGDYAGVSPGVKPLAVREGKAAARPAPAQTLLWVGFTARADRGAELWFQTASPLEVTQRLDGNTLVVLLPGLRRQVRNTRRPIDMRYFESPLARVTAKVVKAQRARRGEPARPAGVEVRVTFKQASDAAIGEVRVATEADGLAYTYLSFAPGSVVGVADDEN